MSTPLQHALDELRAQRAKLDTAIAAIEALIGEPSTPVPSTVAPSTPRAPRTPPAPSNGHGDSDAILVYLRTHGASSPKALAKALKIEKLTLRRQIKALAKARLVVVSGVTASRRVALPGSPAKEAP